MITKNEIKEQLKNIRIFSQNKKFFVSSSDYFNTIINKYLTAVKSFENAKILLLFETFYLSDNNISLYVLAYDLGLSKKTIYLWNKELINNLEKYFNTYENK